MKYYLVTPNAGSQYLVKDYEETEGPVESKITSQRAGDNLGEIMRVQECTQVMFATMCRSVDKMLSVF